MTILILSNNAGGLYNFRRELIEELVTNQNYSVICCVPCFDDDKISVEYLYKLKKLGCTVIRTAFNRRGKNPLEDIKLFLLYRQIIKDKKPDVVLTYTIKPNVYGGIACQSQGVPYIANVTGLGTAIENGGLLQRVALTLYRIGLKNARCVFFQNESNYKTFYRQQIVNTKTRIIPGSGVNTKTHRLESYPPDEDDGTIRFLFVGRIMKDKGIEELLEAVKQLKNEGKKLSLDVVGGCDEDYVKLLEAYEKQELITYHGKRDNMHDYYTNAHCVVLPSYHEGMANVLLEAAATGRPVIASDIPGCREAFDEGITGLGCKPRDVSSLVEAMAKMCTLSNDIRRKMGEAGREKIKKQFDRQIVVDAYMEEMKL